MKKAKTFSSLFILLFAVIEIQAATSPLSVSVFPPAQFPPSDFNVTGARVSALFGRHRSVYGADVGLIGNITDNEFWGIAVSGIFNWTNGNTTAIGTQLAGGFNANIQKTSVVGLQLAGLANYNKASSSVTGLQAALFANHAPHTNIYGLQLGLYNRALRVVGFQIGLINFAKNLHGVQIGLLNFHHEGLFKVAPILNVGF